MFFFKVFVFQISTLDLWQEESRKTVHKHTHSTVSKLQAALAFCFNFNFTLSFGFYFLFWRRVYRFWHLLRWGWSGKAYGSRLNFDSERDWRANSIDTCAAIKPNRKLKILALNTNVYQSLAICRFRIRFVFAFTFDWKTSMNLALFVEC